MSNQPSVFVHRGLLRCGKTTRNYLAWLQNEGSEGPRVRGSEGPGVRGSEGPRGRGAERSKTEQKGICPHCAVKINAGSADRFSCLQKRMGVIFNRGRCPFIQPWVLNREALAAT